MKPKSILFSAPMIRALLDGRKTQTRRVIKLPATKGGMDWEPEFAFRNGPPDQRTWSFGREDRAERKLVKLHAVDDLLWVKEGCVDEHPIAIQEGRYSQPGTAGIPGPPPVTYRTIYRVDGEPLQAWRRADGNHPYFTLEGPADELAARFPTVCSTFQRDGKGVYWNSAMFMPRRASRLTLVLTDVRVERLKEISEEDAWAEGCKPGVLDDHGNPFPAEEPHPSGKGWRGWDCARDWYADLWDEINGTGAWDANPWVVAYSFRTINANVDAALADPIAYGIRELA